MATFTSAIKTCLVTKPFNYKDRAPRSEYWYFYLFTLLFGFVGGMFSIIPVLGFVVGLCQFYFFLCGISAGVRRLHDTNRSGHWMWLILVPIAISTLCFLLAIMQRSETLVTVGYIFIAIFAVGAIALIIFFCTKGTVGSNRFGPDPLLEEEQRDVSLRMYMNDVAKKFGQKEANISEQKSSNDDTNKPSGSN